LGSHPLQELILEVNGTSSGLHPDKAQDGKKRGEVRSWDVTIFREICIEYIAE
jgi:hypothetical protein